ncbi:long-chain fatty acid--CoA ligase, partial [Acinetobacter baumannii]
NPLYTEREMLHQFNDAGVKALVALANFGNLVQAVLPKTGIEYLFLTEVGDILPVPKRWLVNTVVRRVKKMVPEFSLPQAIPLT